MIHETGAPRVCAAPEAQIRKPRRRLLLGIALILAGCQPTPLTVTDPADLEIASGAKGALTIATNTHGTQWFDWSAWIYALQHGLPPTAWNSDFLPSGCFGDEFLLYRPSTGELYGSIIHWGASGTDGWCWGISYDMGVTFTWNYEPENHPDGARITYANSGLLLVEGNSANPVHWLHYSFDRSGRLLSVTQLFDVPLTCRHAVRTTEDGNSALIVGINARNQWEVDRLWPDGHIDKAEFSSNGIVLPSGEPPDARNGSQSVPLNFCMGLTDAWLDRVHQTLDLGLTVPCQSNPSHPCIGLYAMYNLANAFQVASWDDPSYFLPGVFASGSTDNGDPNRDIWAPRITADDLGNLLFVGAWSGPAKYASMLVGGLDVSSQLITVYPVGPTGRAPYKTFPDGTTRNFDYLGIAPDPSDRSYVWGFGHAVQDSSGATDVSTATVIRFGRHCDPVTGQCNLP